MKTTVNKYKLQKISKVEVNSEGELLNVIAEVFQGENKVGYVIAENSKKKVFFIVLESSLFFKMWKTTQWNRGYFKSNKMIVEEFEKYYNADRKIYT